MIKGILRIVFLSFIAVGIVQISKDIGYKQGQIDALTNNIQYELIVMPDKTKVWEKIEEGVER